MCSCYTNIRSNIKVHDLDEFLAKHGSAFIVEDPTPEMTVFVRDGTTYRLQGDAGAACIFNCDGVEYIQV